MLLIIFIVPIGIFLLVCAVLTSVFGEFTDNFKKINTKAIGLITYGAISKDEDENLYSNKNN